MTSTAIPAGTEAAEQVDPRVGADPTARPCQDSALGWWHYYTEDTAQRVVR